ncbi:hypothetical protein A0H76_592 [Hepatospora eriocheir]|uniref:Uncharacterized protein n=1 Tax=Hepatospora eriocheir TaxID=1081669 RepID=A0A1X0QL15_9MICR|nr:hypothetical protein A0H76_592 [Hepatospora eriocheir]
MLKLLKDMLYLSNVDAGVVNTKIIVEPEAYEISKIENAKNPILLDAAKYKMVPTFIFTMIVNPNTIDCVIPPPIMTLFNTFVIKSMDCPTVYPLWTHYAYSKFPGYSCYDSDKILRHFNPNCNDNSGGKCPEGYKKISLKEFADRTDAELDKLVESSAIGPQKKKKGKNSHKKQSSKSKEENKDKESKTKDENNKDDKKDKETKDVEKEKEQEEKKDKEEKKPDENNNETV